MGGDRVGFVEDRLHDADAERMDDTPVLRQRRLESHYAGASTRLLSRLFDPTTIGLVWWPGLLMMCH